MTREYTTTLSDITAGIFTYENSTYPIPTIFTIIQTN